MAFANSQGDDKQYKKKEGQEELERGLYLLGANITSWSTKAKTFMQGECPHDVVMMVEHRQRKKINKLIINLKPITMVAPLQLRMQPLEGSLTKRSKS